MAKNLLKTGTTKKPTLTQSNSPEKSLAADPPGTAPYTENKHAINPVPTAPHSPHAGR